MKIAIDSWPLASRLRHHGTYVYTRNLIAQFRQMAVTSSDTEFCLFTSPRAANDANEVEVRKGFERTRSDLLAWDRGWRLGAIAVAAAKTKANVVFSPTPNIPLGPTPVVCTIHDAIPLKMRVHSRRMNMFLRSLMWAAARFSRAIVTDSECSRNDLLEMYNLPEAKVSVVHLGYDADVFNDTSPDFEREQFLRKRLGVRRAYIFHHGVIQPRKNLLRLIQAYRRLLSNNRNLEIDLVLAGRIGWEYEDVLAAAGDNGELRGRVILTGPLEDGDLAILVKKATLVVIPSLHEGFCLPMVEAMACGVPTLASNFQCLVEISGGVLDYFNPLSLEEMTACIERYLENNEARTDLARRGKARAAMFSWQRCATETLDVLKKSCGGRP